MKGSRISDIKKTITLETKVNSPDKKLREIALEVDLPISTVADIIKNDLPEVCKSSENIAKLIDVNDNLQSLADALIAEKLKNKEETVKLSELVSLRESTFKQNQLLRGKTTENVGFVNGADILLDIQNGKITKENAYEALKNSRE